MSDIDCRECRVHRFKNALCSNDICKTFGAVGNEEDFIRLFTRPRGEWIEQEDDYHHYWECSECGMGVGLDDIRNFCPNCGSDNRKRREDE